MTTAPAPATEHEGIPPAVRRALKKTVLGLRAQLEDDFRRQLAALGISESGVGDVPSNRTLTDMDATTREKASAVLDREVAGSVTPADALDFFVEECAFTFLNWAFGLRCLEERDLLIIDGQTETAIRVDPARGSSSLYWRVRNAPDAPTNPRDVWRETFRQGCEAMSEQVSVLFDQSSEYAALFPLLPTVQAVVDALNALDVAPETYATDELLGWVYQYFNSERKDEVFAAAGKGKKIEGEDIIAATQIYTERYMVDFLLQNSLGRMWVEMHPETRLPEGWPYYLAPPEDNPTVERDVKPLRDVTVLDPSVGSGHFLLRAADLLFDMYEEEGIESRQDIPRLVLERNLYGIDIDLRSVQIAALALYMKAATHAGGPLAPERLNLVAADVQLTGSELPKEYMERFQGEKELEDLVRVIWQGLHHVRELGSLLHPERAVDEVLERRRAREPLLMQEDEQWERWKRDLLDGLRDEFEKQTENGDIGRRLLGAHVARGITFVDLLSRKYDVVCTNPPYMGSGNMGKVLKDFVAKHYKAGKRDLYAAFILRCRELALDDALVAMVTQQSWMFLRSFADLRAISEEKLKSKTIQMGGILREAAIEAVAHLGSGAFDEISGEVVNCALFVLRNASPAAEHRMVALRLIGTKSAEEKARYMVRAATGNAEALFSSPLQRELLAIPEAPFVYWLRPKFFQILSQDLRLRNVADVCQGLRTTDNERFLRFIWEIRELGGRWFNYSKGGQYQKWFGLNRYAVDFNDDGQEIKESIDRKYPYLNGNYDWVIGSKDRYFEEGLCYSCNCRGSLGLRQLNAESIFDPKGPAIFPVRMPPGHLLGMLSTRLSSYLMRSAVPVMDFNPGYVANVPIMPPSDGAIEALALSALAAKRMLVSQDATEMTFELDGFELNATSGSLETAAATFGPLQTVEVLLAAIEGAIEAKVCALHGLAPLDVADVVGETGRPAGWQPLVAGRDDLPRSETGIEIPQELVEYLVTHERRELASQEMTHLKHRLRALYVAGPGAKIDDEAAEANEDVLLGAHLPIPAETYIEELSQELEVHPISIYWLLDEMREQEGLACPPEVQRQTEDYLSVKMLRTLGYRWPIQDEYEKERGAPFLDPEWVDDDAIIPLTPGAGQKALGDRMREILKEDLGEDGEGEICMALGWKPGVEWGKQKPATLERWFERDFFKRHIQQFKQRPIAWHFTSPEGAFQAFVLYHRLNRETLTKLRTQYAGAAITHLRTLQERAKAQDNASEATALQLKIEDVEEFRELIEKIERGDELKYRIRCRWKDEEKDGRPGPYAPDVDDGVKVNTRPFQEAGLLAATVIKKW